MSAGWKLNWPWIRHNLQRIWGHGKRSHCTSNLVKLVVAFRHNLSWKPGVTESLFPYPTWCIGIFHVGLGTYLSWILEWLQSIFLCISLCMEPVSWPCIPGCSGPHVLCGHYSRVRSPRDSCASHGIPASWSVSGNLIGRNIPCVLIFAICFFMFGRSGFPLGNESHNLCMCAMGAQYFKFFLKQWALNFHTMQSYVQWQLYFFDQVI
jgi:hypothetical protein